MLNIVLVEPEIPNNTETLAVCGHRKSFALDSSFWICNQWQNLKRSGLDYWVHLDVTEYQNVGKRRIPDLSRVFLMSSHASKSYLETDFQDGDWLVLVKRVKAWAKSSRTVRKSPNYSMSPLIRSFNIANSVAFVIGETKGK
jgi:tRNA (cytidine/uridine-2'-O-)-methyltransferase